MFYIWVIDQVCSVKMAGYWPSSFFAWLWTETKSRSINSQKKNKDFFSWNFFLKFTYDTLQYNTLLTILLTYTTTTLPTNYIHYFRYLQSWLLTKLQYFPYIIQISFFYNLYYYFTIVHVWTYSSLFPIWNTNSLNLIKHERKKNRK